MIGCSISSQFDICPQLPDGPFYYIIMV